VRTWDVSCGLRCPAIPGIYQNDITLIDDVSSAAAAWAGWAARSRLSAGTCPAQDQRRQRRDRAGAGAQVPQPASRRWGHPGWSSPGGGGLVPARLAAGGRPRGRIGPARPGSRPASASARRSRNSIGLGRQLVAIGRQSTRSLGGEPGRQGRGFQICIACPMGHIAMITNTARGPTTGRDLWSDTAPPRRHASPGARPASAVSARGPDGAHAIG